MTPLQKVALWVLASLGSFALVWFVLSLLSRFRS